MYGIAFLGETQLCGVFDEASVEPFRDGYPAGYGSPFFTIAHLYYVKSYEEFALNGPGLSIQR